jgi:hypothetical protein
VQGTAGLAFVLEGNLEVDGVLTDASAVTLDITYGAPYQAVADFAGPFTWSGAMSRVAGEVWQAGTGQYAYTWQVPGSAPSGVYVATWTFTEGGTTYTGAENIWIQGSTPVQVPAGDTGYWTGGLVNPSAGLDIEFGKVDGSGTAWLWQSITGWDGPPVQGAGVIPRAGDHGAWASPQWYAARTMTLTCTASAQSQALRDVARATLQQAVPVGDAGQMAVLRYDEPIPKQCLVRRSGQLPAKYPTLADVTFTIGLVAPDMRKYGTAQKTLLIAAPPPVAGTFSIPFSIPFSLAAAPPPTVSTCMNAGTFGSPPVAVVTGPCTGPSLTNQSTGETVSWSQVTLGSGQTMTADFLNRQAWISAPNFPGLPGLPPGGGTYASADIGSAWWDLEPGTNVVAFAAASSGTGASAAFYYFDAWVLGGTLGDVPCHQPAVAARRVHIRRRRRQ